MLCKNCDCRPVCVIYKDIQKHTNIALINVEECAHHNGKLEASPILKPSLGSIAGPINGDIALLSEPMTVMKEYKDFNTKPELVKSKNLEKHTCEFCESQSDAIYLCEDCGTEICESCENVDIITNKKYCDFCWEKR